MDLVRYVTDFTGPDEHRAQRALDHLRAGCDPFLRSCLGVRSEDDRRDAIQNAWIQLWQSRSRLRYEGTAAWYALLKRSAYRCLIDVLRSRKRTLYLEELEGFEVPEEDRVDVESLAVASGDAVEVGHLFHTASVALLGLDETETRETHERQLLAAQLFYLDGRPWDRILRLLGPSLPGQPSVDRATLDRWLTDPGVIRFLAFHRLYYSNDRLAGHLLGLSDPVEARALNDLLNRASAIPADPAPPAGWTWNEARALLWHYHGRLSESAVLEGAGGALTAGEYRSLLVRSRQRFPFNTERVHLLAALDRVQGARKALTTSHVWQRLALQYRYDDDLSHKEIVERLRPAAMGLGDSDEALYRISPTNLNAWLSGGRLLRRLARFLNGATEGESDA